MKTCIQQRGVWALAAVAGGLAAVPAMGQTVTRESVGPANFAPFGAIVAGDGNSDQAKLSPDADSIVFRTQASNWQDGTSTGLGGTRVIRRNRVNNSISLLNDYGTASPPLSGSLLNQGSASQLAYRGGPTLWVVSNNWGSGLEPCPDNNNVADIARTGSPPALTSGPGGVGCPTPSNGSSANPDVTRDGLRAVFDSASTTFVSGGVANRDVYTVTLSGTKTYARKSVTGNLFTGITPGNADSVNPSVGGGRVLDEDFVFAFESLATNLVGGDTNNARDIYMRVDPNPSGPSIAQPFTARVSIAADGTQANGPSFNPDVSADGRFIVYSSDATNLVAGDTNGFRDIFIRDRQTGSVKRLSVSFLGAQANSSSDNPVVNADGKWVAFESTATNLIANLTTPGTSQVYLVHVPTGSIFLCGFNLSSFSSPNAATTGPSISDDGLRVAFHSAATNLIASDTNNATDVFIYARGAIPSNDNCADAIPLDGQSGTLAGSLNGALPTAGLTGLCGTSAAAADVWYAWTATCTGSVTFNTVGSPTDTVLAVYNTPCGSGTPIVCDDDGGGSLTSLVNFPAVAGTRYLIRVSGFNNRSGDFTLNWSQTLSAPSNDACLNAINIGNGAFPFTTCGATTDGPATSCGPGTANNDVWYRYTATASGPVTVSTCGANFDTMLAVYGAFTCPVTQGQQIACNDDFCDVGSRTSFTAVAGQTYLVRVGGFYTTIRGQGTLTIGPSQCNPADIAASDASPGADGQVNNGDFQLFFSEFFSANCPGCAPGGGPKCNNADIAQSDGSEGFDGCVNNGDFQLFFTAFFSPCI